MMKTTKMLAMLTATLTTAAWMGTARADYLTGAACSPKNSTEAAKIRYTANRAMNTSTTASAVVVCTSGAGTNTTLVVNDHSSAGNISCTGFYYVTGILSNIGVKTSTGTGVQGLTWPSSPGIGETWAEECTLPAATGGLESQMSSIESVSTN